MSPYLFKSLLIYFSVNIIVFFFCRSRMVLIKVTPRNFGFHLANFSGMTENTHAAHINLIQGIGVHIL